MRITASRKHDHVKEFFLASLLVRAHGHRDRHAWRREVLRARTPQALMHRIDSRRHIAYASNGVDVIRIELINTGSTVRAPIAGGAQAEPLAELLERILAHPTGIVVSGSLPWLRQAFVTIKAIANCSGRSIRRSRHLRWSNIKRST
jgi:hypothetical protein